MNVTNLSQTEIGILTLRSEDFLSDIKCIETRRTCSKLSAIPLLGATNILEQYSSGRLSTVDSIIVGRSLELVHSGVIEALTDLAGSAPNPTSQRSDLRTNRQPIADWFRSELRRTANWNSRLALSLGELTYLTISGALRAYAISIVLRRVRTGGSISSLVDHGSGVGMIPRLLCTESDLGISSFVGVEPSEKFIRAGDALWKSATANGIQVKFERTTSNSYRPEPCDAILFCHMIYNIPADRRASVLKAGWDSLNSGGVLLLNEQFERPERHLNVPNPLTFNEFISILPVDAKAGFFFGQDNWKIGHTATEVDESACDMRTIAALVRH